MGTRLISVSGEQTACPGVSNLYKENWNNRCNGKIFAALGAVRDPRLEAALVDATGWIFNFRVVHTTSMRVIAVD